MCVLLVAGHGASVPCELSGKMEVGYQQDVLVHPPPFVSPEEIPDWQARTLGRITAMREALDKTKATIQAIDGQMCYDFQRLSQLGMLGSWPGKDPAANEHIQSPASPAVTVAPLQPCSPSPPPASDGGI